MSEAPPPKVRRSSRTGLAAVEEAPVYLASQLASICDVDLKTIHNWTGRTDPDEPSELESFRTPGGHLRFRHDAVLRFLSRWGYPIPDELLRDRPHILYVEPDPEARRDLVAALGLVRPGEDPNAPTASTGSSPEVTQGLWATGAYYLQVWDDPYLALVALGERLGAGAAPDVVVLRVPLPGIDDAAWIRAARAVAASTTQRFVLVGDVREPPGAANEPGVVELIDEKSPGALGPVLRRLAASVRTQRAQSGQEGDELARRRRASIAPREPIFVASQVAAMWDVELKTVHNWVDEGALEAFRTPGRHLRFRRRALLAHLRKYGRATPTELTPSRPTLMFVAPDALTLDALEASLGDGFSVVREQDTARALGELGARSAGAGLVDGLVVALPAGGVDDARWLRAVLRHQDTRYTRVVVLSDDDERAPLWHQLGVMATLRRADLLGLRLLFEGVLGLRAA